MCRDTIPGKNPLASRTVAKKVLLSWSSGKDCGWALHVLRGDRRFEVAGLLTTVNDSVQRVAMHAVREQLLEAQAAALGLPLFKVPIPSPCPNDVYEGAMAKAMEDAKSDGIGAVAFGDLFLEDIRRYREEKLTPIGIEPVFPIWGLDTTEMAHEMVRSGLRAIVTCIDKGRLDASFAGREYDGRFLDDLPDAVDPCGENGEFHSFVYAGPMFSEALRVKVGELVDRDGFVFADVLLAER